MRERFRVNSVTEKRKAQISLVNGILEEYNAEGYTLTLRQIYYQLVARGIIKNNPNEYKRVSKTLEIGRYNGLIDWAMIEDRTRIPYLDYYVDSIQNALEDTVKHFKYDRQEGQPYHMEIWTEKDAVSNILRRVSEYYHVELMVNRGFSSHSAFYDASKRKADCPTVILYVGDHDPSGLDMIRDIRIKLHELGVCEFEVVPVALTMNQIQQHELPSNPIKIKDPRAWEYLRKHGESSWELDALAPRTLEEIVRSAVLDILDEETFKEVLVHEKEDRESLRLMVAEMLSK